MATRPTPAVEAQAPVNHFGRMFGVFVNPKATFVDIATRPSWIAPLVLLTILGLIFSYVMNQRVDWESFIRQQAEKNPRFAQFSDQQKQQALEPQIKWAPRSVYAIGALGATVFALFLALVYWGAFNLLAGAALQFGTCFAITVHAFMPSALGSVLGIVVMSLKQRGDVDPERLLASSVGAFLSSDAPRWLVSLGASLELFWVWVLTLLAVGYAAAKSKKITLGRGLGIVFGLWAVWVLIKMGWAAI